MTSIALVARRAALALAVSVAPFVLSGVQSQAQTGIASVYSTREGSSRTASGIPLRDGALTAASRTLPLGSHARVTNLRNHRSIVVLITDRGPFIGGRIIDLTPAGARALDIDGLAPVSVVRA